MKTHCAILASVVVVLGLNRPVFAELRIALIIGNGEYGTAPLSDPVNDATLMARTLRDLGFEVTKEVNLGQNDMKVLIRNFGKSLKARKDAVGLFYYSGHGMQAGGRNYMIPIGATIEDESDVEIFGIGLDEVLSRMRTAGNAMNFLVLDACRNNGFEKSYKSAANGLGKMSAPKGTLIAFAAQPHKVALQGEGKYSVFTESLAREIVRPGVSARDALLYVRNDVNERTGGKQVPVVEDQFLAKFYFRKTAASLGHVSRVREIADSVNAAYIDNRIDRKGFGVKYSAEGCTDDTDFMNVSRGLAAIISYYYMTRMVYLDQNWSEFGYPGDEPDRASLRGMLSDMNFDDIVANLGSYLNNIKAIDREALEATLTHFINYHKLFEDHITNKKLEKLEAKSGQFLDDDFFRLGFPRNENRCFLYRANLGGIQIPGREHATYYELSSNYDTYFYGFWYRRYIEGTDRLAFKLFEYAFSILGKEAVKVLSIAIRRLGPTKSRLTVCLHTRVARQGP